MDYEQKYKESLERAIIAHKDEDKHLKATLERIFPELKKSSFEDIRKAIIHLVNSSKETHFGIDNYDGVKWDEMLAWLDKPIEEINGKDYGIDGLWHAKDILENTLGKVDGYQTDDGILEHKAAIEAVNKLYNQGQKVWSEKDLKMIDSIIEEVRPLGECPDYPTDEEREYYYKGQDRVEWLERLKTLDNAKWLPSELQLSFLSDAVNSYHKQGYPAEVLTSLLDDLRKYRHGVL